MYVLGVDIGSTSSKAVVLKEGAILACSVIPAGTGTSGPERVLQDIFRKTGLRRTDMRRIVATGYGRFSMDEADRQVSEISCHARGVHHIMPGVRTILDIGGQDVKAIELSEEGRVENFFMNDKCAAGTGRFIEVMANLMELHVSEMATWDARSEQPVTVSSTCTVFAESEVISLLSQKKGKADIIRGVHESVISRAMGLLMRTAMKSDFGMTGGAAQNAGVVRALERQLRQRVRVSDYAQIMGAIGAALFAWQDVRDEKR